MKTYIYDLTLAHSGEVVRFRTYQPNRKLALEAARSHVAILGREVFSYRYVGVESPDTISPQTPKKV